MSERGIRIGGLTLMHRDSAGGLILASYHPRSSLTWHWAIHLDRRAFAPRWGWFVVPLGERATQRSLRMGMWTLGIDTQSYHKEARK